MNPARSLALDQRFDIECLLHRASLDWPDVIEADGSASSQQTAIVPAGVVLAKALLPYREVGGQASTWSGAALVGTRAPNLLPYLHESGDAAPGQCPLEPKSADELLDWYSAMAGVGYAPPAFLRVAGWELDWTAHFLFRLFKCGADGALIVAERQAAAVLRAAWTSHWRWRPGLLTDPMVGSDALLLGRALVDMALVLHQSIAGRLRARPAPTSAQRRTMERAMDEVLQRLGSAVRALKDARRAASYELRHKKLGKVISEGRALADAVSLFTVAGEDVVLRVERLRDVLRKSSRPAPALGHGHAAAIIAAGAQLERTAATAEDADVRPSWNAGMAAGLDRLNGADVAARVQALGEVPTDLIFKLLVTRRLDRVFQVMPWMLAPAGAFPDTFGGPCGAISILLEGSRVQELAAEHQARTVVFAGGPRLDTHAGQIAYATQSSTARALQLRTPAGFLLSSSVISHTMVQAFIRNEPFHATHPLPALARGSLNYCFATSIADTATAHTVITNELAKPIYSIQTHNRDLPRYLGLVPQDLCATWIVESFPTEDRDSRTPLQRALKARARLNQPLPVAVGTLDTARRELLRSMLKAINTPLTGRTAVHQAAGIVSKAAADVELDRFDREHAGHVGIGRNADGEAIRARGLKRRAVQGPGATKLAGAVRRARTWWPGYSHDDDIAAILSGQTPPGLTPAAQEVMPVLWFKPDMDSPVHDWIAAGAPLWAPLALSNIQHAGLIAREVRAVMASMPGVFGLPICATLRRRIDVLLWTGWADITADHAHVR